MTIPEKMHDRMESLSDLLIAGGLSVEERAEAERHAGDCAACGTLLRDAREFSRWAKGVVAADAPPSDLEERLVERFRAAGQSKKRRFIVGKRVLKVTGSIAAAVALIFLGNMVGVQPGANGKDVLLTFKQTYGAHDHPADEAEVRSATRLRGLTSAESDFRAHDRDGDHATHFWTGDVKRLYKATTVDLGKNAGALGYDGAMPGTNGGAAADLPNQLGELGFVDKVKSALNPSLAIEGERPKADKAGSLSDLNESLLKLEEQSEGLARDRSFGEQGKHPKASNMFPSKGEATATILAEQRAGRSTEMPDDRKDDVVTGGLALKVQPPRPPAPLQDNRKIIRTADASVEVDSYEVTSIKLSEIVNAEKGFLASANTQKMANGKIQATVVVRIPPDRFDAVLARLKELGTIRYQNIGSEDVTKTYVDLQSRQQGKEILAERLRKLLAEGKGTVKELMEVEVQLGNTNEAIERIKGEIKYYDNRIGLSTLTLQIAEKDLGQPFEYVQTLQANLALTARDPDEAYVRAQKEITNAGGQVVDSRMSRQNDGSSVGTVRARVEADKFNALRDVLKKLGFPTNDTVTQQRSARGGQEGTPKVDAPLRKELASLDLTISSPPLFVTHKSQLLVETSAVESAYQNARKAIETAGGKIVDGALAGRGDRMQGSLRAQVDADKFAALVESLKTAGTLKNQNVNHVLPTVTPEGVPLLRERAEIEFTVVSPPQLIGEEHGLVKTIRDTFANSWEGVLWSVEKLFVGLSLAGPWLLLLAAAVLIWRRARRKKAPVA